LQSLLRADVASTSDRIDPREGSNQATPPVATM
jgi:hypothetical protein